MRCTFLILLCAAVPAWAEDLRVGAAAVVITPPPGTPMAGYYSERLAAGVHDDLYARALVLEKAGEKAALVALDLISTPRDLVEEARQQIERATGLRGTNVMISATHSHTGPVLQGRGLREDLLGAKTKAVQDYRESLPSTITEAVRLAEQRLAPAMASIAHGHEPTIAFNRRFHMRDGTVGWNPGKRNPNILKPAGTIDPDVPIVFFATRDRKPLAAYINYAVHLDNVGGLKISADMPSTLIKLLAEVKGPEMVTIYTTGCCGDVNHIDVAWAEPQHGFDNAARMGIILAGAVLRAWPNLKPIEPGPLRIKSETVKLPLSTIKPGDVEKARETVRRFRGPKPSQPAFLETVDAFKVLDVADRQGRPWEVEVQAVALGRDLAWVSLPGEIFVELGLTIKQDSPFPMTILAELANGSVGYVPARRAYAQGNYEVVSARCAEGSGELLVETAVRLLKDLYAANPSDNAPTPRDKESPAR
jgi:neutral ceramidase